MTESRSTRKFADELVSQDAAVSGFDFEEFSMNLQKKLESIEHRAGVIRRSSLIALVTAVVGYLGLPLLGGLLRTPAWWVPAVWAACTLTALITAGMWLSLYWCKYRPAVDRARTDLQISMISDLQRQLAALSQRMDDRANK
jgi:hypothetical protein